MSVSNNEIWTIGHSTRTFDEFIVMLKSFSIKTLVDVRSMPGSNKFPQYNQDVLQKSLKDNQIDYKYFEDLGGRRKPNPNSKNTIWRNKSFRAYADYMETEEFNDALEKLEKLASKTPVAIMCAEAVWWRCHRSMIADALKAKGWKVTHIMNKNKATEHPYTQPAQVTDGQLKYGEEN
ncbi:MAG TPA: DUF488 domain-containing protein [Flavobacteriaceae bacterium]|nr:DUF488 domain-containing protein [Flavobacteriaceae bacterium]